MFWLAKTLERAQRARVNLGRNRYRARVVLDMTLMLTSSRFPFSTPEPHQSRSRAPFANRRGYRHEEVEDACDARRCPRSWSPRH